MNHTAFQIVWLSLLALALFAMLAGLISFAGMLFRWRTPKRRVHVIRLLVCMAAIPLLIGAQFALTWWIYFPALARQQMAEVEANRAERFRESTHVLVDAQAPDFAVETLDGDEFSLAGSEGKVVLINFFATWCGPCHLELPHLQEIWNKHGDDPRFRMIMIAREETEAEIGSYQEDHGIGFPMAADPTGEIYRLFADRYIPRNLVVSPEGQVVFSSMGFVEQDLEEMRAVIKKQLADLPQPGK